MDREQALRAMPGNGSEYHLDRLKPLADSPLKGKRILFLGSSVTFGAASLETSMADYLRVLDGCRAVKEAVSGTTLVDRDDTSYVSRLKRLEEPEGFDAVVLQLSTNDATKQLPLGEVTPDWQGFDTGTVAGAMEEILSDCRKRWNCPVLVYTGTRFDSETYSKMVALLPKLQEKWGIFVLDLWHSEKMNRVTPQDYALYMCDPIHPTQAGYLKWWLPEFQEALYKIFANNGR